MAARRQMKTVSNLLSKAAPRSPRANARPIAGIRLGRAVALHPRGVLVDFPGNDRGPLLARSAAAVDESALLDGQAAVLAFEDGDPRRPLLLGFLQPLPGPRLLAREESAPAAGDAADSARDAAAGPGATRLDATVDGRRVLIEGREEIVLRCGEASVTLHADGKVDIRGTRVTSTARGTNRLRGGSVQIN